MIGSYKKQTLCLSHKGIVLEDSYAVEAHKVLGCHLYESYFFVSGKVEERRELVAVVKPEEKVELDLADMIGEEPDEDLEEIGL
jgi:hypothetical protein